MLAVLHERNNSCDAASVAFIVVPSPGGRLDMQGALVRLPCKACSTEVVLIADPADPPGNLHAAPPRIKASYAMGSTAQRMNAAAALSRAGLLVFLSPGTALPPFTDQHLVQVIGTECRAWGVLSLRAPPQGLLGRLADRIKRGVSSGKNPCAKPVAVFVRRDAFDAVGGVPASATEDVLDAFQVKLKSLCAPLCLVHWPTGWLPHG